MLNILVLLLLAGVGASCRDYISLKMKIPRYGTLIVNIVGAFLTGVVFYSFMFGSDIYNLLALGFLGGFTTYSTFAKDQYILFVDKEYGKLIMYTLTTFLLGMIAFYLGAMILR